MEDYRLTSTGTGFSLIKKTHAPTNPKRHFHPWWEILFIVKGDRTLFYGDRIVHIGAGTFVCIPPGVLHRGINEDETCFLFNLFFSENDQVLPPTDSQFAPILKILEELKPLTFLDELSAKKIASLFESIGFELKAKKRNYSTLSWSFLTEILVTVSRKTRSAEPKLRPVFYENKGIALVMNWINEHFDEEFTLSSLAKKFGYTSSSLSRSFKEVTHFGFIEYVNSIRIAKACKLLRDGSKHSVLDIALSCGFGSVTQFGRCFKNFTGTTPLKYRK